jgi:hypothetical protein
MKKTKNKKPSAGAPGAAKGDYSVIRAALVERKDKSIADRIEIQNAVVRGSLVLRERISFVVGRLAGTWSGIILQLGETWGGSIAADMGVSDPAAQTEIRNICIDRAYEAAHSSKEALGGWVRAQEKKEGGNAE